MWYWMDQHRSFEVTFFQQSQHFPESIAIPPPIPVLSTAKDENIISQFVFLDEMTGVTYFMIISWVIFISPWPCVSLPGNGTSVFWGYYLIPPPLIIAAPGASKKYYFDTRAASWDQGAGGSLLCYFFAMWLHHGIDVDKIQAFEMTTDVAAFYHSMPDFVKNRTYYLSTMCSLIDTRTSQCLCNPICAHPYSGVAWQKPPMTIFFMLDIDSLSNWWGCSDCLYLKWSK